MKNHQNVSSQTEYLNSIAVRNDLIIQPTKCSARQITFIINDAAITTKCNDSEMTIRSNNVRADLTAHKFNY